MKRSGFSIVELLIVMVLVFILGGVFVALTRTTAQASRFQREITDLEQNTAVVQQMLQNDLRLAGYRGGANASDFAGASGSDATAQARVLGWLNNSATWQNAFRSGGLPLQTLQLTSTSSTANLGDEIRIRYISRITLTTATQAQFTLQDVGYRWDDTDRELERQNITLTSGSFDISNPLTAPTSVNLSANTATWQPVADGLDNFQVFFQQANGTWQADNARPAANTSNTGTPPATSFGAVGVYIRVRAASSRSSDCGPWPKSTSQVANNAGTAVTWSSLNVASITYTAANCNFRRLERVIVVAPTTPVQYW